MKLKLVAAAVAAAALVLPATAAAQTPPKKSECKLTSSAGTNRDYTCTWGPIQVSGYQVRQNIEIEPILRE